MECATGYWPGSEFRLKLTLETSVEGISGLQGGIATHNSLRMTVCSLPTLENILDT